MTVKLEPGAACSHNIRFREQRAKVAVRGGWVVCPGCGRRLVRLDSLLARPEIEMATR